MAYEFKKLSDVAVVEIPADTANVLIEEDGVIKKVAKKSVGETSEAILGKIATVDAVEEPSETANVLIEESGAVKKVPIASVGSGIKTAIITDNVYDAFIARESELPKEQVFRCVNMTYEEAKAIILSGESLDVFFKCLIEEVMMNSHAFAGYVPVEGADMIVISVLHPSEPYFLFWTADGFSTEPPTI